jgi:hypothetical protein
VSHFDVFFRANYRRMVGYCSLYYNPADAEEEVASVIHACYDEYMARIPEPGRDDTMRRWMNRRVLLNLKSRYVKFARQKTDSAEDMATAGDDDFAYSYAFEPLHFDDPESIVSLQQQMPPVHPILIEYEPYAGGVSARGENTSADKTRFCRERKKFMTALAGGTP